MERQSFKKIIKDHFLAGLLVLAPILIVVVVVQWMFGGVIAWVERVPLHLFFNGQPSDLAGFVRFLFLLGTLLGMVIITSLVGFFSRLYLGRKVLQWLREGLQRIPIFGSVYSSLNQLFQAISSSGGKQFSRVVYVEYPRKGVWSVAFVTADAKLKGIPPGYLSIFIPTVPNPTSGFHLMVSHTEVVESGLKVDEAFRMILSLGVAGPYEGLSSESMV